MAAPEGVRFRDLLLDPGYWRPRLEKLGTVPWRLLVFPRPDLSRPGVEVIELSMRAHDGVDLRCILARPAFSSAGDVVHLRVVEEFAFAEPDWNLIEEGRTDLVVTFPPQRRLEDRVLDVLRVTQAAASAETLDWERVDLSTHPGCDELVLADLLRAKGWA
ncbi:MAG: hypothetical protein O7B99_11030 [Planctomycetota bacterium]|nr:hypothetical protein [Planctomycetota bacterium]